MENEIDKYIRDFPAETQVLLQQIRLAIRNAAPDAVELISYRMPAYRLNGILVYFAGYKNHIGFYPTSSGIEAFSDRLSGYRWARGSVQFPINKPLPLDLIAEIVKFRIEENLQRLKTRSFQK